jgi:hypothetical protein
VGVAEAAGAGGCDVDGAGLAGLTPDRDAPGVGAALTPVAGATASGLGDASTVGSTLGWAKGVCETRVWRSWMVEPVDGRLGLT